MTRVVLFLISVLGWCTLCESRLRAAEAIPLWPDLPLVAKPGEAEPGETMLERGDQQKHDRRFSNVTHPSLSVLLPEHPDPARPAIVVCPGGGYSGVVTDKEGFDVAARLNAAGIAAFMLKYRMPDGRPPAANEQPMPIQDVQRAIRMVRANAKEWNIDPGKVGVMGFSAGGHVASTAATQFDAGGPSANDLIARQSSRPDFVV